MYVYDVDHRRLKATFPLDKEVTEIAISDDSTIAVAVLECHGHAEVHVYRYVGLPNSNGFVGLSVGFVSEHKALDFKPVTDMKMKICDPENEDKKLSIYQKIEFSLQKIYQLDPQYPVNPKMYFV